MIKLSETLWLYLYRPEAANTSAECKLAKVALMTISLCAPISPLATIWGSLFAKANAVYNPIVYGISHPKYRAELYKKFPSCLAKPLLTKAAPSPSGATAVSEEKPAA
ncbi:hypothetical protein ACJJTC_009826 [Scirpophaga incertulas]